MAEIIIKTDGTIEGTSLTVDGKEITSEKNIVRISLNAEAAWNSSYSDNKYPGQVHVGYRYEEEGTYKNVTVGSSTESEYSNKIGEMKSEDSIIRFVGAEVDSEIKDLVDKISDHCEKENITVVDKTTLYSRSIESLTDKAHDLGIDIN